MKVKVTEWDQSEHGRHPGGNVVAKLADTKRDDTKPPHPKQTKTIPYP